MVPNAAGVASFAQAVLALRLCTIMHAQALAASSQSRHDQAVNSAALLACNFFVLTRVALVLLLLCICVSTVLQTRRAT